MRPAGAEALHRRETAVHVAAALEYDGPRAREAQQQRGEHARRAEADHDGPLRALDARDRVFLFHIGGEVRALLPGKKLLLPLAELDGERADVVDIVLLPRVERAAHEFVCLDLPGPDAQLFRCASAQRAAVLAGQQTQIAHEDHPFSLPASAPLDQAHCRLKPPQSPSMSSTSPQA